MVEDHWRSTTATLTIQFAKQLPKVGFMNSVEWNTFMITMEAMFNILSACNKLSCQAWLILVMMDHKRSKIKLTIF